MAPEAAIISPPKLSETARERELYRYYQPSESARSHHGQEPVAPDPQSSTDVAITAFAQLGALRLQAKRGIISLVGTDVEYILAEAGRTLSLQNDSRHDEDDRLWHGVGALRSKAGIGSTVIKLLTGTASVDALPHIVVNDLREHHLFKDLPIVREGPCARFLACLPLRTPAGYVIGLYSVIDDKPRMGLHESDLSFLEDMAATAMNHVLAGHVKTRHHRAERMIKALGLYLEGGSSLRDWWITQGEGQTSIQQPQIREALKRGVTFSQQADTEFGVQEPKDAGISRTMLETHGGTTRGSPSGTRSRSGDGRPVPNAASSIVSRSPREHLAHHSLDLENLRTSNSPPETRGTSQASTTVKGHNKSRSMSIAHMSDAGNATQGKKLQAALLSADLLNSFGRASNLIRESMDVEGVMFLDASVGSFGGGSGKESIGQKAPGAHVVHAKVQTTTTASESDDARKSGEEHGEGEAEDGEPETHAPILGFSTRTRSSLQDHQVTSSQRSFSETLLRRLAKRHPHGKVFSFDDEGAISSSEGDFTDSQDSKDSDVKETRRKRRRRMTKEAEAKALLAIVPGSRSIAWFPLWDSTLERWYAGSIIWSTNITRVLSSEEDLTYMARIPERIFPLAGLIPAQATFGNSIMAEVSRINASVNSQMKEDFISSISHELRSPLHGILASVEFLQDGSSMSNVQVDMIDTIKSCSTTLLETIDHVLDFSKIKKHLKEKKSKKRTHSARAIARSRGRSRQASEDDGFDLRQTAEEVIDSVLASRFVRHTSTKTGGVSASGLSVSRRPPIVIVNMQFRESWTFDTDQGALRRIIMNVFSNALKYTERGFVLVELEASEGGVSVGASPRLKIIVRDSGKGISKDFLQTHVYTPFRQEDPLAVGTGLGLSIVRQLVVDLGGNIDINSDVGSGTQAFIVVPLRTARMPDSADANEAASVKSRLRGAKACIMNHGFDYLPDISEVPTGILDSQAEALLLLKESIQNTLENWFDVDVIQSSELDPTSATMFVGLESRQIDDHVCLLRRHVFEGKDRPIYIALREPHTNHEDFTTQNGVQVFNLQLPVTPRKLTTVFSRAEEHKTSAPAPNAIKQAPNSSSTDPSSVADASSPFSRERDRPTTTTACDMPLESSPDPVLGTPFSDLEEQESYFEGLVSDRPGCVSPAISNRSGRSMRGRRGVLPRRSTTTAFIEHSDSIDSDTASAASRVSQPLQVMLVEDNSINLRLLEQCMKSLKFPYTTAHNGFDAVQAYKSCSVTFSATSPSTPTTRSPYPAVIFMDVQMPIMNGLQATREIRVWEQEQGIGKTIVVALTANTSGHARQEAFTSGVDLFLTKPVSMKRLRLLLTELQNRGREALKDG